MAVLPDYLGHGLRVVFCGTAAGETSAARGHYYAGPGNEFWLLLFESGLTHRRHVPTDDVAITSFGIGLTDLAKNVAASSDHGLASRYDVPGFVDKIEQFVPAVVAFHGKEAAKAVSRALGHGRKVALGSQSWRIGDSRRIRRAERERSQPERKQARGQAVASRVVRRAARARRGAGRDLVVWLVARLTLRLPEWPRPNRVASRVRALVRSGIRQLRDLPTTERLNL